MSNKKTSDLNFDPDIVAIFFSEYEYIYNDEVMHTAFADKAFNVDTYSYIWVYREICNRLNKAEHEVDDTNILAAYAIKLYPDLKDRKIELQHHFRDFIELGQVGVADYSIDILSQI
tara:strand:+ start:2890 stop:3240 length:351 start_codon:yes stop_codon:yes gene_type:complete